MAKSKPKSKTSARKSTGKKSSGKKAAAAKLLRAKAGAVKAAPNKRSYDFEDFDHTGPGTLMGRYLRTFWHPILVGADLAPGRTKPVRLMSEDFTLYRGKSGTPYLIDFRCAHRRTQLSIGWVDGEHVHCRYHGWGFDGTGQCVAQPAEPKPFSEKVKIGSYPVREYAGLIFAYIGEGQAPAFPRYPELEGDDVIVGATSNYHDYNYFNQLDNDPLHVPYTHGSLEGGSIFNEPGKLDCELTEWGLVARIALPDGTVHLHHSGMPNINHVPGGFAGDPAMEVWSEFFGWRVPIDDEHGCQFNVFAVHVPARHRQKYLAQKAAEAAKITVKPRKTPAELAREILAGRLRIEDVNPDDVDPPNDGLGFVLLQDQIIQCGQGVIMDRKTERLARSDISIALRRKLLTRELKALAAGKPLAQWTYDAERLRVEPRGKDMMTKLKVA